jgi:hypothetical protein
MIEREQRPRSTTIFHSQIRQTLFRYVFGLLGSECWEIFVEARAPASPIECCIPGLRLETAPYVIFRLLVSFVSCIHSFLFTIIFLFPLPVVPWSNGGCILT